MSKTIKAVTVTKDYINRKLYVIKMLVVFSRKDGTPYWHVTEISDRGPVVNIMRQRGLEYCRNMNIPYFDNVMNGQNLTDMQIEILRRYAL